MRYIYCGAAFVHKRVQVILDEYNTKGEKCMKRIRKLLVFMLALAVLSSSPIVYVSASENQVKGTTAPADQLVNIGTASVTFKFIYSDGSSAKLAMVINHNTSEYSMPNPPTSHFSGDTCYASIVLEHKITGEKVTLSAWCDIYGQTG